MDKADIANEYAQAGIERTLAARLRYTGISATECDDCGGQIPAARRQAIPGCRRCCECQNGEDRRSSQRRDVR